MWKILLPLLILNSSLSYSLPIFPLTENPTTGSDRDTIKAVLPHIASLQSLDSLTPPKSLNEIKALLKSQGDGLSSTVIDKVVTTVKCARERKAAYDNILTIVDYSLPSNIKRLWIFDLNQGKLLFHTYVSHGIKSGVLLTTYFSNKNNSKASSIGVYKTEKPYIGRHGLSLQLNGLDAGFNDNAASRAVVMHGGWYVEEDFIKKYGRAGRSWGCPAVPDHLTSLIINTIKEKSMLVIYYPSESWFARSRFLKCDKSNDVANHAVLQDIVTALFPENDTREDVLLVNRKLYKRTDEAPVVAMDTTHYEQTFHKKPPLERMLRRQINNLEYIALSNSEFNEIMRNSSPENSETLREIRFIKPKVVMVRGYYETQMEPLPLGNIKEIKLELPSSDHKQAVSHYTVYFDKSSGIGLSSTHQFIRWLGL